MESGAGMGQLEVVGASHPAASPATTTARPPTPVPERSANPFGDREAISSSSSSSHSGDERQQPPQPAIPPRARLGRDEAAEDVIVSI